MKGTGREHYASSQSRLA